MGWKDRIQRAFREPGSSEGDAAREHAGAPRPRTAVLERLRRHVIESSDGTLSPEQVDDREHLYDAGYLDSQSSASLLELIEAEYGVEVSETDLVGRLSSLEALAHHVQAHGEAERSRTNRDGS